MTINTRTSNLGYPRIGANREWKKHWKLTGRAGSAKNSCGRKWNVISWVICVSSRRRAST